LFPSLIGSSKTTHSFPLFRALCLFPSLIGSSKTEEAFPGVEVEEAVSIPHRKFKNLRKLFLGLRLKRQFPSLIGSSKTLFDTWC